MMNTTTKSQWIRNIFLMLAPLGSPLLFAFIRTPQTVVGSDMSMYLTSRGAPLVYLFFGICLVLWIKLFERRPNKALGWLLVLIETILFFLGCLHIIRIEGTLPAILIWISVMASVILLS